MLILLVNGVKANTKECKLRHKGWQDISKARRWLRAQVKAEKIYTVGPITATTVDGDRLSLVEADSDRKVMWFN